MPSVPSYLARVVVASIITQGSCGATRERSGCAGGCAQTDNRIAASPDNGLAPGLSRSKGLPPTAVAIGAARSRGRGDATATANLARVRVDERTEKNR